jgi:hypothetical protein
MPHQTNVQNIGGVDQMPFIRSTIMKNHSGWICWSYTNISLLTMRLYETHSEHPPLGKVSHMIIGQKLSYVCNPND